MLQAIQNLACKGVIHKRGVLLPYTRYHRQQKTERGIDHQSTNSYSVEEQHVGARGCLKPI